MKNISMKFLIVFSGLCVVLWQPVVAEDMDRITVTGDPGDISHCISLGTCPVGGGGGGGGGGDNGGGFGPGSGNGASGAGSTPLNPKSTPGQSNDCPSLETLRIAEASEQIRAAVGAFGCVQQRHRNVFWRVNFAGNRSGVYRGIGDCRSSLNNIEIISPGC